MTRILVTNDDGVYSEGIKLLAQALAGLGEVVIVAPEDDLFEKTVSNMQEVAARGGRIVLVSNADPEKIGCPVAHHVRMPTLHPFAAPLVYALPMQLIAYHTAVLMGTDVDQPRNLAKSVTVE